MSTNNSDDGVVPFPRFLSSLHRHRHRQRKQSEESNGIPSIAASGDLILLEHSLSLPSSTTTTATAASVSKTTTHVVDDEEIYRRAQVRTPTETATRERVTGGLFLRHVIGATETKRIVVLQTTDTILSSPWLQEQVLKASKDKKMSVISVAHDTSGWDNDDEEEESTVVPIDAKLSGQQQSISVSLDNIEDLFQTMEQEIRQLASNLSSTPAVTKNDDPNDDLDETSELVVVMIESIIPLVMRHGWDSVMYGLQDILSNHASAVMWIPVWTETCTSRQLMQLEDWAQAVLWMRHGDLHVLQKPRQQGAMTLKTRRGIIPFDIHYNGEQQEYELELLQKEAPKPQSETVAKSSSGNEAPHGHHHPSLPTGPVQTVTSSRTTKPVLRMEEDDDVRNKLRQPNPNLPTTSSGPSRPQIYIQDDDPEFDDLDEEDPDDDLDL